MWEPMQLASGRWFVVRTRPGGESGNREFLKEAAGVAAAAFNTESQAAAQAGKMNDELFAPAQVSPKRITGGRQ